ncbi:hypothetical protein [Fodinibius saliphilus]|uniref:hypothetical protein n=1 Tax=Fodinibius saliphilus TaxID=1920650 RepID=UPI001108245C|nr:hypothetical protein [Fodinibius saliphilus]
MSSEKQKKRRGPNAFIRMMQQMARQQQQQRQQQNRSETDPDSNSGNGPQRFEQIEEAEFEEITEEEKTGDKSSD